MEEQNIIEKELKHNTKSDIICYIGMGFIFIMIFIPPIFRLLIPKEDDNQNEIEIVYLNLVCTRVVVRDNQRIEMLVNNTYKNSIIQNSVMEFRYEQEQEIPEVNEFLAIESEDIKKEQLETGGYRFTFDFTNPNVMNIEELANYKLPAPAQRNYFENNLYYGCDQTSSIENEEKE